MQHVSTGDLFRAEIKSGSPLGNKVQDYVNKGMLVPDEVVVEVVAGHLDKIEAGYLLDGFPRTLEQAQELDKYLTSTKQTMDLVLYIAMKEEEVVARLASRWSCGACGEVYNVRSRPPKLEGKCDKCSGDLSQREDDQEATIRKRLMAFEDLTKPLVAYYRSQGQFQEIDGGRKPEEVTKTAITLLDAVAATSGAA